MTPRTRRLLIQVGSFILAGVLLYLALRGVDFSQVGQALREADYRWIPPLALLVLLSHLLRVWRWQVLLEALPPAQPGSAPPRVSIKVAFYSLMIGYMVNYAAPRLGEVARTANLSAREHLSFSAVLGTVVVERILDVVVLALGLVSAFFLLFERSHIVNDIFIRPIVERLGAAPTLGLLGLTLGVAALVVLLIAALARRESSPLRRFWTHRVYPMLVSFRDGLATVLRSPRRLVLVVSTAAIWFCYVLMAYVPFLMFGMAGPYNLTLLDAWSIMLLGALGVAIPSPGGVGSFHYITIQTLVHLYSVDQAIAATYAVFVHGAQMVLYILVGFLCLVLQGSSLGAVRRTTRAASGEAVPPPRMPDTAAPSPTAEISHDDTGR